MIEKFISREELMILLNESIFHEKTHIMVHYPLFGINLFEIEYPQERYRLTNIISKEKFINLRESKALDNKFLQQDLPHYSDIIYCFGTSGYLKPTNWNEFTKWVSNIYEDSQNLSRSPRKIFIAPDTNILYNRVFSRLFPITYSEKEIKAKEFNYVLSDAVKKEVDHQIKWKYTKRNIEDMTKIFGYIAKQFINRGTLITRKAKLAQYEMDYLRQELKATNAEAKEWERDKEDMDIIITESYSQFQSKNKLDVIMISADQIMADHAKNNELRYFILSWGLPPIFKDIYFGHQELINLLYDLAVTFGIIQLRDLGVTLFGIWHGKKTEEYATETIKMCIDEKSRIYKDVMRDIDIVRKLNTKHFT